MGWTFKKKILVITMILAAIHPDTAQSQENSKLTINDKDLDNALGWGIHCISNIFNPDDRNRPYFECYLFDNPRMEFNHRLSVGNVTGRCLYALLRACEALGIEADQEVISIYRNVLFESYSKVRGLPADPKQQGGPVEECWTFNSGQGMRGLLGLTIFCHDVLANKYLEESITNLHDYYVEPGFSWKAFSEQFHLIGGGTGGAENWPGPDPLSPSANPFLTWSVARYARWTQSEKALQLACDLGNARFDFRFPPDGILRIYGRDHGFEIAAETNALAETGTIIGSELIMSRVKSRIDNGLTQIMTSTGWFPEKLNIGSDVGEANNTGEIIEACLLLGDWGWHEYYGLAERFTRAHLLPSQLLDVSIITESPPSPPKDGQSRVRERTKGAFGFPAPYGHLSTKNPYFNGAFMFDIVGGAVATLAEVKQHCYRKQDQNHYINLLFDYANDNISIKSPYPDKDTIEITLKDPGDLHIRLSSWVDRHAVKAYFEEKDLYGMIEEPYFIIPSAPLNETISIKYPLTLFETTEDLNGRPLSVMWRGDSVIGMSGMETCLPFFPDIDIARRNVQIERLGPEDLLISSGKEENTGKNCGRIQERVNIEADGKGILYFDGKESRLRYGVPFFPVNDYTFEAWIRPATGSSQGDMPQRVFSGWRDIYDDPLRVTIQSGHIRAGLETDGKAYETNGIQISSPGWFHVTAVKAGSILRLYVNGKDMTQVVVPRIIHTQAKDIGIGFNPLYGHGEFYKGKIGAFSFKARALNDQEISQIIGSGMSAETKNNGSSYMLGVMNSGKPPQQ